MAFQAWMAKQDRSGVEIGPSVAVPPGTTTYTGRLTDLGFLNPAQTVGFRFESSFDGGQTWQDAGSTGWTGGVQPNDKNGNPVAREYGTGFVPGQPLPTHMRVVLEVAGTVNCGVDVEFGA